MTLLIQDAKAAFLSRRDPARTGEISELMYADDTLILAVNNEDAEIYMQCIELAGRTYGLQLTELEQIGSASSAMWSTHQKNPMEIMWFRKSRCFIWEVSCVTMAVLGLSWIDALARQGRNLKHCAVSGTTLFSQRQTKSKLLKLAYFRNCCIVCLTTCLEFQLWRNDPFLTGTSSQGPCCQTTQPV